jgi:predicted RNase H-like nuclease
LIVAGADGCRTGWVICLRESDGTLEIRVVKTLAEACEGLSILAVDMPIGLTDTPRPGRACEGEARALMPGKASSVFPLVSATCGTQREAIPPARSRHRHQPATFIFPKMREVDELLRSDRKLARDLKPIPGLAPPA